MFLHILTKLHRPSVAIADCSSLARFFILLYCLAQRVQPELVFVRFASRVVPSRHILEVNVLKVIVE